MQLLDLLQSLDSLASVTEALSRGWVSLGHLCRPTLQKYTLYRAGPASSQLAPTSYYAPAAVKPGIPLDNTNYPL